MNGVFILGAALVPILGSIWVAISALLRHRARVAEEGYRQEHLLLTLKWMEAEGELERRVKAKTGDWGAASEARLALGDLHHTQAQRLLEYRGYAPDPSYRQVGIDVAMSGRPLSADERRDQWVLIWCAVLGVLLLALGGL